MESSETDPTNHDRLNGWKEIAAFLGKGVRTVQRWEGEYGLPVRRIGHPGGEIVFAIRSEVDQWSRAPRERRSDADAAAAVFVDSAATVAVDALAPLPSPVTITSSPRASHASIWMVLAAVATTALVATIGWPGTRGVGQPSRARVEHRQIRVYDDGDRLLWSRPLTFRPNEGQYRTEFEVKGVRPVLIEDLDGDGSREVLLATHATTREEADGVYVFDADGRVRFHFKPDPVVDFGGAKQSGPWLVYRMFVETRADGRRSMWIVFIHGLWFPSVAYELDDRGKVLSTYWSNGYIESIRLTRWRSREVVLIGGTNNESQGASLAILDYGAVNATAPAESAEFRCSTCAPGTPIAYLVFPRRCIAEALEGQATINEAWIDRSDSLYVMVSEGPWRPSGGLASDAWYTIGADLRPRSAEFADSARVLHASWFKEGRLDHPFGSRDESKLFPIRFWDGSTFSPLLLTPPKS